MFPSITRSRYIIITSILGLKNKPTLAVGQFVFQNTGFDSDDDAVVNLNTNKEEKINKEVEIKDNANPRETVYIGCSFQLEDQIVIGLKLDALGVYLTNSAKAKELLEGLGTLKFRSKKDAIKNEFIKFWRADFLAEDQPSATDFKRKYTIRFITSSDFKKPAIETHLNTNCVLKPTTNSPSYKYVMDSLELVGGRSY